MIVLAIGDIHEPFSHKKYHSFIMRQRDRWKPDRIVSMGDEVDQCALGNYDQNPDGMSAGDELNAATKAMQKWYKEFPDVTVMESNHGLRPFKKAFKAGLPSAYMRGYREFLKAPTGWEWAPHEVIDGAYYFHGEPFGGPMAALKAAKEHRMSCVIGHIHAHGGVQYTRSRANTLFGLNCGAGLDEGKYAFQYAKHTAAKTTHGCGIVIDGVEAFFIPMEVK